MASPLILFFALLLLLAPFSQSRIISNNPSTATTAGSAEAIKAQQHNHKHNHNHNQSTTKQIPNPNLKHQHNQQLTNTSCSGRWIHIVPLPPRFNSDLLSLNCTYPLLSSSFSLCSSLSNHGLGPRTHNLSRSWFRTHPLLSLDPLFHRRLLEYPCLTPDPSAADALFLPFYASIAALPFLYGDLYNSSSLHALDLFHHLRDHFPQILTKNSAHDLFMVAALPAWDLSQDPSTNPPLWGTSLLQLPQFINITVLTVESRASPWQEQAVPYPTSFHPATLARLDAWIARARRSRRTNLVLFVGGGGGGGPNIRGSIKSECENRSNLCEIVDCSNGVCAHDPVRFMPPMLRSDFCLQPPGDTPTRRSTFDGILAGCIPVFFEEISAKLQYGWHLPKKEYDEFSVFIPKEDVVFGGVRIVEVLEKIPREKVRKMRERVLELAPSVMYRRHGSSDGLRQRKDAFDLAIDGVLRRVKRRVRAISEPELLYEDDEDDHVI